MKDSMYNMLEGTEPVYFYRVNEAVGFFGEDDIYKCQIQNFVDFRGPDLLKSRHEAERYYYERLKVLQGSTYHLRCDPSNNLGATVHVVGTKDAIVLISLALVEYFDKVKNYEHCLLGDWNGKKRGRKKERKVLRELGYM